MIKNVFTVIIDENNNILRRDNVIRGNEENKTIIRVITPYPISDVASASFLKMGGVEPKSQFIAPTLYKGHDVLDENDELYQLCFDWAVRETELRPTITTMFSKFRSDATKVSFTLSETSPSSKCVSYKGKFGVDISLPSTGQTLGDYYECDDWNYQLSSGGKTYLFGKGQFVYWSGTYWVKDRLIIKGSTVTTTVAIDPNVTSGAELDDDEVNYLESLSIILEEQQESINTIGQNVNNNTQDIVDMKDGTSPFTKLTLTDGNGNDVEVTYNGKDVIFSYRNITGELFKNLFLEVEPASGVTFENGMNVMYAGSIGASGKRLAKPTILTELQVNPNLYLGMITKVTTEGHGIVNWYGEVNGLVTTGFTLGQPVYVGNNGGWVVTKPTKPLPNITVGLIERVHGTQGRISVRPNIGNYLGSLHDVYTNGHVFVGGETIKYNITNNRYEIFDLDGALSAIGSLIDDLENANMIKSIVRTGTNLITITYFDDTTSTVITLSELKSFIGNATQSLAGLMSAQDKIDLDTLMALFDSDGDAVVNTIAEVLAIFNNYPDGADLVTALAGKVDKNNAITAGTKTKITYDSKGLVTSGADLEELDIPELPQSKITNLGTDLDSKVNKNADIVGATKTKITYDSKGLVTAGDDLVATDIPNLDAGKITSGTFGVDRIPSLAPSKITQDANNRFVTDTEKSTWNGKQNALTAGDGISISGNVISADGVLTVETWNTSTKTLALSDSNKLFKCSHTDFQTVTIPTNATVVFPIGTMISFLLTSTYPVTFIGASGVTLTSMDNLVTLATQYGMASLIKTDTNTWQLVGDLGNYYTKNEIDSMIGDIESVLDAILGV